MVKRYIKIDGSGSADDTGDGDGIEQIVNCCWCGDDERCFVYVRSSYSDDVDVDGVDGADGIDNRETSSSFPCDAELMDRLREETI